MNFFPFKFSFEQAVVDFTNEYMEKITTPSAIIALHTSTNGIPSLLVNRINEELVSFDLPQLANINIWRKQPKEVQTLHVDVYVWDKLNKKSEKYTTNKAAFNIPVEGTGGSTMVWYDGDHNVEEVEVITSRGTRAIYYDVKWHQPPQLATPGLELLTSHFVKTDKPHRVYAGAENTRVITSLRFKNNPSLDFIFKKLRKYDNTNTMQNEYFDLLTTEDTLVDLDSNVVRGYN